MDIKEFIKQRLKELENRTPEEEEKSSLEYCKDVIKDKNFKLVKWKLSQEGWTHDHCDFCAKSISNKKGAENEAYTNKNEHWLCKECFKKYKEILGLREVA